VLLDSLCSKAELFVLFFELSDKSLTD